ncbi:MAG: hypothetical protein ABI445_06760, partial [Polyangia bacterium]
QRRQDLLLTLFAVVAFAQFVYGILAIVAGFRRRKAGERGLTDILVGAMTSVGALMGGVVGIGIFGLAGAGGAWGRPLRIRGKQLHPSLTEGADWTDGPRPDPRGLDVATRRALEALWLHDAQKEHASVPAFSRVSWLLAAAGAPAELLVWCHRAATEEIEHTRACFALAAGYGDRTFTVEPMPELLLGGLDGTVDPRITLAIESLSDGCQLEDFNADVAAACADVCEEPVTRTVLERIAIEERSHAELSWAILTWLVERHREVVTAPLASAMVALDRYARPTAVAADKLSLVNMADPALLRSHGRLRDDEWQAAWDARLVATRTRLHALEGVRRAA